MPAQQRLRAHNERRPTRTREHPADRRHEQPVSTAKARPADLALEHRELMAKDHELDVVVQVAGRAGGQPECPAQQQIEEREEHGPDLLPGRGSILRNTLATRAITGFCALHATACRLSPHGQQVQRRFAALTTDGRPRRAYAAIGPTLAATAAGGRAFAALMWLFAGSQRAEDPSDMLVTVAAEDTFDASPQLHRITAPTLLVAGGRYRFYSPELSRETADRIPNARLRLYQDQGHAGVMTHQPSHPRDRRLPPHRRPSANLTAAAIQRAVLAKAAGARPATHVRSWRRDAKVSAPAYRSQRPVLTPHI